LSALITFIGDFLGNIVDAVSGIIDALKGVVKFITGIFTGDWEKAWQGVQDIFKGIFDALVSIVKTPINLIIGLINGMISGITDGINAVIKAANSLSFDVPDWVPIIGGQTWGFNFKTLTAPKIPKLATGTVVPANYGEFMNIMGDSRYPEIVSPVPTMKQAIKEVIAELGGLGGGSYTFIAQLNGKTIYEETVRQDQLQRMSIGRSKFEY
jgi:hypothetical protein